MRPVIALLALLALGCGLLGDKKPWSKRVGIGQEVSSSPGATTSPERPTDAQASASPAGVQGANRIVLPPDVPTGTVLAPVKEDYEYLHELGDVDACPEGTTPRRTTTGDTEESYCALSTGVRHGPWVQYWRDGGRIREIGPYVAGFRHGVFTTWDEKGRLTSRYRWDNGQVGSGEVFVGQ